MDVHAPCAGHSSAGVCLMTSHGLLQVSIWQECHTGDHTRGQVMPVSPSTGSVKLVYVLKVNSVFRIFYMYILRFLCCLTMDISLGSFYTEIILRKVSLTPISSRYIFYNQLLDLFML